MVEAFGHPEGDAGRLGRRSHLPGFLHRVGLGLLARDVFPGRHRGQDVVVVEMGGGEDLDGVDVRVGQEVVQVGEDLGRPPGGGGRLGQVLVGVADGHHVAAVVLQIAGDVQFGDVSGADHTQTNTISLA